MSPERVYWISFAAFSVAAAVSVGIDIATDSVGIATALAAGVPLALAYVAAFSRRNPERSTAPKEWGAQVYLTVAVACLFVFLVGIELFGVIT
ncbi:hypothetical protein ACFQJC_09590 [Haloferax namakaokahaiae]|uniref:Uncharacterized protein n=1 Tax=Haloferax namakaokahaiae TaxID=1748331 RepID=A0ABD5ZFV6_9EURY